jgi:sugar/nucleoside kinase (ribokinase family)
MAADPEPARSTGHGVASVLAVLGDLVEDVVVRLDGPINVASDTPAEISRRRGGSAANVAVAAAALGQPSRFIGHVGLDAIGTALLAEMSTGGVDVTCVRRGGSTGTIVALVDTRGERSMLTDRRACIDLTHPDPTWLSGVRTLHVPLYSLAVGPIATSARTLIGWAHERAVEVSIDLSSRAVMHAMGIDEVRDLIDALDPQVILANADEARTLDISTALGRAVTVVKNGRDPVVVHSPNGSSVEVPAITLGPVNDTTGAGDAFAAGFLAHPTGWRADPVGACESGHRCAAALFSLRAGR